jgi:HEAT repeat protein
MIASRVDENGRRSKAPVTVLKPEGQIEISLVRPSEETLRSEVEGLAEHLHSSDAIERQAAAYGLSTLDTPLVIPHLAAAARMPGLERRAIDALGKFESQDAQNAIASALPSDDIVVVEAALGQLGRRGIYVGRQKMRALLDSRAGSVRYETVKYLTDVGDASDTDLLTSLTNDENPRLADAARKCDELLRQRGVKHPQTQ